MNTQYETIRVRFLESIKEIDKNVFEDDMKEWGASSLKEWIEGYDCTRFTNIGEMEAIVTTSRDNLFFIKEWFQRSDKVASITTF